MAGQPPEPSFQPSQEGGLTQGRPAWQQPSYSPPAGSGGGQQGYAAQQQPPYSQDQYPPQDQTYTAQPSGQEYSGGYQGFQSAGYPPPSGQGAGASWDSPLSGGRPAPPQSRSQANVNFIASLFDFSFENLVTPKIIRVIYILLVVWVGLMALTFLVVGFTSGGFLGGLVVLVIVDPILILLSLGIYRVFLEAFMVIFRIYDEAKQIRVNTQNQS